MISCKLMMLSAAKRCNSPRFFSSLLSFRRNSCIISKPLIPCRNIFSHDVKNYVELYRQDLTVNPGFGVLSYNGAMDVYIGPANPQEYPDADRAFVSVLGRPNENIGNFDVSLSGQTKDTVTVEGGDGGTMQAFCKIELPIKYDLSLNLRGNGSVQVVGMEADEVAVTSDQGTISTRGLKSHNIRVSLGEGTLTSDGTLQGNLYLVARKAFIKAKRLQGLEMNVTAEELKADLASSYVTKGVITAQQGHLKLSCLHGTTQLTMKEGQLDITGLHGQFNGIIGEGSANVQVSEITDESSIQVDEGDVKLFVMEHPRHNTIITAKNLDIDSHLSAQGKFEDKNEEKTFKLLTNGGTGANTLSVKAGKGSVVMQLQDWFSTLGIKLRG